MAAWNYSNTNETNLMKIKYGKLIEKQFNKSNVILGRIKKLEDHDGKQIDIPLVQSIGGGVGAGSLPTANPNKIGKVILNSTKKNYGAVVIDRESMKASKKDEGSFVRLTKYPVRICVESFNRNITRQILKGDINGSGKLVTWATGATAASGNKVYFDNASTFDIAAFEVIEEGDLLDIIDSDGSTVNAAGLVVDTVEIIDDGNGYLDSGSYIEFASSPGTVSNGDFLVLQNSLNSEMVGIKGVISATSGTYKNVTIGRRFKSYQKSAASAAISTDLMNDVVVKLKKQCGESPDLILMGHHQYVKFLNLLEDQKVYNLPARSKKFKGQISFSAIEFMSSDGPIPVVMDRMMDADEVFFLNTKHISLHCRPGGFEWFDEDGTVFLREASADAYGARYGGYSELFVNPHFQGRLHTLAR